MNGARRGRAARAARAAQQVEDGAKLAAFQSRRQVVEATTAISAEQDRTCGLIGGGIDLALRAHLLNAGVRHKLVLEQQREELERAAQLDDERWAAARRRVRSLDKLVERLDAVRRLEADRADRAESQDLIASRVARP